MKTETRQVILDTDIGNDIDDTWALGLLLKTPELKTELVLSCSGDTTYRATIAAAFLERTGFGHIPVGVGIESRDRELVESLSGWLGDYRLDKYPGKVARNGVAEAIRIIENSDEITIIAIGPMTNLAEICRRRPELAKKCRLVAMAGSIRRNFRNLPGAVVEYNVITDLPSAQAVFAAEWKEFILTPLDHCGNITLSGDEYQQILHASGAVSREIIAGYHAWLSFLGNPSDGTEKTSSVLYDTAAVHLAASDRYTCFETLNLIVDDAGFVRCSAEGKSVKTALDWSCLDDYKKELLTRLFREDTLLKTTKER